MKLDSEIWVLPNLKRKMVSAFIIDETNIQNRNQDLWLWFSIERNHSSVLGIYILAKKHGCC
jgi:hypothetical protein